MNESMNPGPFFFFTISCLLDKVAVLVCMDDYVDLDEDYRPNKKEMSDYNPRYKQQRQAETPCVFFVHWLTVA